MRKFASRAALAASMTLMSFIAAGTAHAQVPDMLYAQNNRAVPGGYQSGYGPRVAPQPNEVMTGNRRIDRDPDPFIRGEILRHYNSSCLTDAFSRTPAWSGLRLG